MFLWGFFSVTFLYSLIYLFIFFFYFCIVIFTNISGMYLFNGAKTHSLSYFLFFFILRLFSYFVLHPFVCGLVVYYGYVIIPFYNIFSLSYLCIEPLFLISYQM